MEEMNNLSSAKFMDVFSDDKTVLSGENYSQIKGDLTLLGITLLDDALELGGLPKLSSISKLLSFGSDFVEGIKSALESVLDEDEEIKGAISGFKGQGLKVISSNNSLGQNQMGRISQNGIKSVSNELVSRLIAFFAYLNMMMNNLRKQKQEEIKGRVNISDSFIATMPTVLVNNVKNNADKGFTILGVNTTDDISFLNNVSTSKTEEPAKLELVNPEILKLKQMREEAMKLSMEKGQAMSMEKGVSMTMKKPTQYGFIGIPSLLIFMGLIATITEISLLLLKILK